MFHFENIFELRKMRASDIIFCYKHYFRNPNDIYFTTSPWLVVGLFQNKSFSSLLLKMDIAKIQQFHSLKTRRQRTVLIKQMWRFCSKHFVTVVYQQQQHQLECTLSNVKCALLLYNNYQHFTEYSAHGLIVN